MEQEVLVVSSKEELQNFGYLYTNVNKEVVYDGLSFLLKQCGIRNYPNYPNIPLFGYGNPYPKIVPRKPLWILNIKDMNMIIQEIK
jgi:hypothetical protein